MKKLFFTVSTVFLVGVILFFWVQYYNKKEPKVMDKLLSTNDINDMDAIKSYKAKYQHFPGPTDEEVLSVAKILISSNLTADKVEQLLGKPSDISEKKTNENEQVSLIFWGYNIGDSRRMTILFDLNGNLVSIRGVGVGFDELTLPPKK